jgi:hypothetical protein
MTLEKFLTLVKEDTYTVFSLRLEAPDSSVFKARILPPTEGLNWWKCEIEVKYSDGRVDMSNYSRMNYRSIVQLTERKALQKVPSLGLLLDPPPKPALTRIFEEDSF